MTMLIDVDAIARIRRRQVYATDPRPCVRCFQIKPPEEFGMGPSGRRRLKVCNDCQPATQAEYANRNRGTAQQALERKRRWRAENPELAREQSRRYREKLREDKERLARKNENRRMAYRMKAYREGRPIREYKQKREWLANAKIPAAPLAAVIDSRQVGSLHVVRSFEERYGVPERTVYRWRSGEVKHVGLSTADTVLTAMGLLWWDVWNENTTDPEGLAVARQQFEGDDEMAA